MATIRPDGSNLKVERSGAVIGCGLAHARSGVAGRVQVQPRVHCLNHAGWKARLETCFFPNSRLENWKLEGWWGTSIIGGSSHSTLDRNRVDNAMTHR